MAAQSVRRRSLTRLLAGQAFVMAFAGQTCAQDTSFLSGEELAGQLRQDLVWIAADDVGEHGWGLVIGSDADTLWVVTARHVIVRMPMRGDIAPEEPSRDIRARLCASATADTVRAEPWPGWDAKGDDIAVLRMPRPRGYEVATRALAARKAAVGEPVWLLGSRDECALVPAQGGVRAAADAAHNLRIDFPGVQGGSSGAPVLSGWGIVGLMKSAEDLTATVHDISDLQRRLQVLPPLRWELADARNIPPADPRAAEVDIAETLNQYLLALRNVHGLLQMPRIARQTLDDYTSRYNAALRRFLRVREAYDGSLARHWTAPVLPAWRGLRDSLWGVHQNFWRINPQMEDVFRNQRSNDEVRAQMQALEPELVRLEKDIAQFLRLLDKEPRP